jgi:hypothetical protein
MSDPIINRLKTWTAVFSGGHICSTGRTTPCHMKYIFVKCAYGFVPTHIALVLDDCFRQLIYVSGHLTTFLHIIFGLAFAL